MEASTLAHAVARILHDAVPSEAGLDAKALAELLESPPDTSLGDLAFPCFRLAKALRNAPPKIAAAIAERVPTDGLVAAATPTGPYVNLRLSVPHAAAMVLPARLSPPPSEPTQPGKIMVEYSQPNTHKGFHVGHMRNLCLGDALVRMLRAAGHPVVAANYLGDVGAHIAKCLWWYLDRLEDRTPPAEHRGEWLGSLYTAATNQLAQWEDAAKAGDTAASSELDKARARTTEILLALENRDPELLAIWEQTRQWSLDDFAAIYDWCGVTFDRIFYESEVDEPGLALVEEFKGKGVFTESEGAVGIFNEEVKHMPFFMLRKSDGTSLYSTKDLALARLKFEEHAIDRSIYVVDTRQSDHFRHVFLTLKKMGFDQAERCEHVPYEMVELPEGAMSSRGGNVILFRTLRERMVNHVREHYLARFADSWEEDELASVARAVALGAIKYGMLNRDVNQKIVFDLEAWLDLEGNTGPYLQYAQARIRSILHKCAAEGKAPDPAVGVDPEATATAAATLVAPEERELVLALDRFEPTLAQVADTLRPSVMCTYLFQLAKTYNRFNAACPVKPSEGALLQGRLLVVRATLQTLVRGLDLLGIPAPERM